MRKIVPTLALAVAMILAVSSGAHADGAGTGGTRTWIFCRDAGTVYACPGSDTFLPADTPDCARAFFHDSSHVWATFEDGCGVTFNGKDRAVVSFVEYVVDFYGSVIHDLHVQVSAQLTTIAQQRAKIARQHARILRLKERLSAQ